MLLESNYIAHFVSVALTIALPVISVGLGQGLASKAAIQALNQQPLAYNSLSRIFFVAMALTETAAVLSTLVGIMLLMSPTPSNYGALAEAGAALTIIVPAICIGIFSALPAQASFFAVARQPLVGQQIMNLLLVSLSILQTPIVFGLIISWLIQQQIASVFTLTQGLKLFATGVTLAIGSIGPTIGLAKFSEQACTTAGRKPSAYNTLLSFAFISQAMIETPILFSLIISLMLYFSVSPIADAWHTGVAYLAAACTMGLTTLGTGLSSGQTARAACQAIGKNIEHYTLLSRASIIAQTLIDTNAIYGLVIALIMILTLV